MSLLSELAADMLCREIGIPSVSVVLNAASKFTIIAPNTDPARQAVACIERRVNEWLMRISYGESAIGLDFVEASPADLIGGTFRTLWGHLSRRMERKKFRKVDLERFGGVVERYLDAFRNDLGHPLCPFCGKRPSDPGAEGSSLLGGVQSSCRLCRDHIFLGANLVRKTRIAITTREADIKGEDATLLEPIFGSYQVAFVDGGMSEMARRGQLLKYWDIRVDEEGRIPRDVTVKFISGYVPVYTVKDRHDDRLLAGRKTDQSKEELIAQIEEDVPKTFGHIANKALNACLSGDGYSGIEALGVLTADIDHLGILMSWGLRPERFTLSRLATLSRQVNWFFCLYLPHLLKTHPSFVDMYTVFAGGDDLFLIGPWNRVIELAGLLNQAFREYVCHNKEIHFSAGITVHKPHSPLAGLAREAKAALQKSKDAGRNSITLFSETATWTEFEALGRIKEKILDWRKRDLINTAMLYRLDDLLRMAEAEKALLRHEDIHLEDMDCLKWHALFHYTAERNVGRGAPHDEKQKTVEEFSQAAEWLMEHGARLKIALWDVIYNQRKGA